MEFLIADTFTDSLAKLTTDEQKAVKLTAFELQMNPAHPSLRFHKLEKGKDPRFWSVSVNMDIRMIVHRSETSFLLCYVDHHDDAYRWSERRKLEQHPKTGAAQLVEVREMVKEVVIPKYVDATEPVRALPPVFTSVSDDELLSYGVPIEWLNDVKEVTSEDALLELAVHLPQEASDALLELATGSRPKVMAAIPATANPFSHPDAQRRFRVMRDQEELERALNSPWDKWAIFLHPQQLNLVERDFTGPARVSGSAGTGKTIVALHRAVYLAKTYEDARVLLTTFSPALANALRNKLNLLVSNRPRLAEQIEVRSLQEVAEQLYRSNIGAFEIASPDIIDTALNQAAKYDSEQTFSQTFLRSEWYDVVDAWQLTSWEEYRDVTRLGRKIRLREDKRQALWAMFTRVMTALQQRQLITINQLYSQLVTLLASRQHPPFNHIVVDEAQDISIMQLRFLVALGSNTSNGLFFTGDLGQRIFQQPFSWKQLGVNIRGRSHTLKVNYRTSHQIRLQADRLLERTITDVDGISEGRDGIISIFNGPRPDMHVLEDEVQEQQHVSAWLMQQIENGMSAGEIGVFVRSPAELPRAEAAVRETNLAYRVLNEKVETVSNEVSISTMHYAKGLEFRSVVVMACDDEVIPLQSRIETVADGSDLEEVYSTERHLLYVACTRARDHLLVTSVKPGSEFLDDMCC